MNMAKQKKTATEEINRNRGNITEALWIDIVVAVNVLVNS